MKSISWGGLVRNEAMTCTENTDVESRALCLLVHVNERTMIRLIRIYLR